MLKKILPCLSENHMEVNDLHFIWQSRLGEQGPGLFGSVLKLQYPFHACYMVATPYILLKYLIVGKGLSEVPLSPLKVNASPRGQL